MKSHVALRVTSIYLVLSVLWIIFSDRLVSLLFSNLNDVSLVQTIKGLVFVLLTGVLIYFLIRNAFKKQWKIREELQHYQERLFLALSRAAMGIWDWYCETDKLEFDSTWEEFLGYDPGTFATMQEWKALIHPDDIAEVNKALEMHLKGKATFYQAEYRVKNKKGEWVWLLDRGAVIKQGLRKRSRHLTGTYVDINERKQREEVVNRSEALYRTLVETIQDGISLTDLNGEILFCNPRYAEMLGYTDVKELLGKNSLDFVTAKERETVEKRTCGDRVDKHVAGVEFHIVKQDGSMRLVSLNRSLLWNENNQPFSCINIVRDITDQKHTETELRERENFLSAVLDSIQDGITVMDTNFNIIRVNTVMESWHQNQKPLLGKKCYQAYYGFEQPCKNCPATRALKSGKWEVGELTYKQETGKSVTLELFAYPIFNSLSKIEGVVVYARDITVSRQAERALIESEYRFRSIVEETPAGYFLIDAQGYYREVNQAWLRIHKYKLAEEVVGVHFSHFHPPEEQDRAQQMLDSLLKWEMQYYQGEFTHLTKDGKQGYHKVTVRPITKNSQIVGVEGFIMDISDLKKIEQALRTSEEKYRLLFMNLPEGFALHEVIQNENGEVVNYRFLEINPAFETLTGLTKKIEGKTVLEEMPETEPYWIKNYGEVALTGKTLHFENYSAELHKWYEVSAFRPEENKFCVVFNDITGRKNAEQSLLRLSTAIEQAAEIIMIAGAEGIIQYVNPAFERITGFSREDALGKNPRILKSGKHDQNFYRDLWDTLLRGETWHGHFVNHKKDGEEYEEEATISPVTGRDGQLEYFVAVKRDISRELALEKQLRQSQKMEAIGTLAGGIAHDFNNILAAISGYTDLSLLEAEPGSQLHMDLEEIKKATIRARDLIRQILTFSRQNEQQKMALEMEVLVKEAVKLARASIPSTISIKTDYKASSMKVFADPTQIHQVIMNMASNAHHAMREKGGVLFFGLEYREMLEENIDYPGLKQAKYLVLTVKDTGHGMTREIMERIFEPYYTTKKTGEGTGMGLSIVHGIVKESGGEIFVFSQLGKGTRFEIFFPVFEGEAMTLDVCPSKPVLGRGTVLFIDDEESLTGLGEKLLAKLGYQPMVFTSPLQALHEFEKNPDTFDLIITDHTMPQMTGDTLTQEIRKIRADIPIILCTGLASSLDIDHLNQIGVSSVLYKPFSTEQLSEIISQYLHK